VITTGIHEVPRADPLARRNPLVLGEGAVHGLSDALQRIDDMPKAHFTQSDVHVNEPLRLDAPLIAKAFESGAREQRFAMQAGVARNVICGAAVGAALGFAGGHLLGLGVGAGLSAFGGAVGVGLSTVGGAAVGVGLSAVGGAAVGAVAGRLTGGRPTYSSMVEVHAPESVGQMVGVLRQLPGMRWKREYGINAYVGKSGNVRYFVSRGTLGSINVPGRFEAADGERLAIVGNLVHTHPDFFQMLYCYGDPGKASARDRESLEQMSWSGQKSAVIAMATDWRHYDTQRTYPASATLAEAPITALYEDPAV